MSKQGLRSLPFPNEFLTTNQILREQHYLGAIDRGFEYRDEFGVAVLANPTSRRLPQDKWLELVRWCLYGEKNGGSRQWKRIAAWLRSTRPEITTVVSYSDPAQGHTGALYRASNWLWAPTWHRLRPPPSGNGDWGSGFQSVKDRWVFCLRPDNRREGLLQVEDESIRRKYPGIGYQEGAGGNYKKWVTEYKNQA